MALKKLLFIDTNIWLDFYRARTEAGLQLLAHAEETSDRLIVTYQLESEFKNNRQKAILEGMQQLKPPQRIPRLGIFSDANATRIIDRSHREIEKRVENLKRRLGKILEDPALHDPVYQVCQRIFHKVNDLRLDRDNSLRKALRSRAFRRFLHGCPPRKKNDTSIGDAINWEWMVHCATKQQADLVIVSRDSDYGMTVDGGSYINDHLRQEFSERVSKKRKLLLYSRLSDALKLFAVPVSKQEEEAEKELVANAEKVTASSQSPNYLELLNVMSNLTSWNSALTAPALEKLANLSKPVDFEKFANISKSLGDQLGGKRVVPMKNLLPPTPKPDEK